MILQDHNAKMISAFTYSIKDEIMDSIVYETCKECGHNFPNECKSCPECSIIEVPEIEKLIGKRKWGDFRKGNFDVEYRDHLWLTPLMIASYGDMEGVQLLLGWGADLYDVDVWGWNAVMHAISNGYYDIARELLFRGADPSCKSRTGQSYLDVVYHRDDEKVMQRVQEMVESFKDGKNEI